MLRQLREAADDLQIEVHYSNVRRSTVACLGDIRDTPELLLYEADPKREARAFTLTSQRPMGQKRGRDAGSFVRDTRAHAFDFYRELVQDLKGWQPRAPRSTGSGVEEDDVPASTSVDAENAAAVG